MAEEAPAPSSIKDRIAALNASHLPSTDLPARSESAQRPSPGSRAPPPPPPRAASNRPSTHRTRTSNVPPTLTESSLTDPPTRPCSNGAKSSAALLPPPRVDRDKLDRGEENEPRPHLPPRRKTTKDTSEPSPSLPPRRPSGYSLGRRDSAGSVSSTISSISNLSNRASTVNTSRSGSIADGKSRMKAPEYDPTSLPVLPPKRNTSREVIQRTSSRTNSVASIPKTKEPDFVETGPKLPARRASGLTTNGTTRRLPPEIPVSLPSKSTMSQSITRKSETDTEPGNNMLAALPVLSSRLSSVPAIRDRAQPPPVPLASRPKASLESKPAAVINPAACLRCRDFSGPDSHAARFPRHTISHLSPSQLAHQLTSPFPSPTDKARSLFTWLHHNVAYNLPDFLSGNIKPSTPASTMHSGMAVCEGYASLFNAMALSVGLESIVVTGHGKGFGHVELTAGSPTPPFESNHAWNAVHLPDTVGGWHVIDCCWGAGNCDSATNTYSAHFKPSFFTMGPDEMALSHYPQDKAHMFFPAGVSPPSWEAYIVGTGPPIQLFSTPVDDWGIAPLSVKPALKYIQTNPQSRAYTPTTRFMFNLACPHWDSEIHGKGKMPVFLLSVHNSDGRGEKDNVAFDTDGRVWWADVPTNYLGKKGDTIMCCALNTVNGENARGMTVAEWKRKKGRCGWTSSGVMCWEVI
ncbi:MAG: hypothetical protein M1814_004180 [Vezdaea aestivalis]|nr:MAG: hypothetical protein M1814_004180 [Vezdaea aestivalis]